MHIRSIDLNLLVVLRALLTYRSVTNAASAIGLSQPAVSHALNRLRSHYEDPLFVRVGGIMQPTGRALEIGKHVSEALQLIECTFQADFDPAVLKRNFRIGLVDYAATFMLPALVGKLYSEAPGAHVTTEPIEATAVAQLQNEGNLDFAMGVVPATNGDFERFSLFVDQFVVIARHDHPDIGDRLTLEKYCELRHVRTPMFGITDEIMERQGVTRTFALSADSVLSVPFIVSKSDLLGTVPRGLAGVYANFCRLKLMEVPFELDSYRLDLVWRRKDEEDPAHAWMTQLIRSVASDLDGYLQIGNE